MEKNNTPTQNIPEKPSSDSVKPDNIITDPKNIPADAAACPVLTAEQFGKRIEWKRFHVRFVKRFIELLHDGTDIPDAVLMADEMKCCYETAQSHLNEMKFENYKKDMKYLTFPAMLQLSRTASKDGPQSTTAAKLLHQISEDWSEKNTQIIIEVNQVIEIATQIVATMKELIDSTDFTDKSFSKDKFSIELLRKVETTVEKLSLSSINGNNKQT